MKKNIFIAFILLSLLSIPIKSYGENDNSIQFIINPPVPKSEEIEKAIYLYQYIHDLKLLNKTLKLLYRDKDFKLATETAEMNLKLTNNYNSYTTEKIEVLLKILNGINPTDDRVIGFYDSKKDIGGGYIKYIQDKYENEYSIYIKNYPKEKLINRNFYYLYTNIKDNLNKLSFALKQEKDLKKPLKNIFKSLIRMLEEIKKETHYLKIKGVIQPFTKYDDEKYLMPENWAQIDNNTTLEDILNFLLYGDKINIKGKSYRILGIKDYYNKIYYDDLRPFRISQ